MYEFGDEFVIESYKVPWLIWIQLLVMVLLVFLLFFGFSLFTLLDPSENSASASSAPADPSSSSAAAAAAARNAFPGGGGGGQSHGKCQLPITSSSHRSSQGQDENRAEASTRIGIRRGDEIEERDGSSVKDATNLSLFELPEHPCHFLGLAKQAFLKCFGLDPTSDTSNNRQHGKED